MILKWVSPDVLALMGSLNLYYDEIVKAMLFNTLNLSYSLEAIDNLNNIVNSERLARIVRTISIDSTAYENTCKTEYKAIMKKRFGYTGR